MRDEQDQRIKDETVCCRESISVLYNQYDSVIPDFLLLLPPEAWLHFKDNRNSLLFLVACPQSSPGI